MSTARTVLAAALMMAALSVRGGAQEEPRKGFRGDFLAQLADAEKKLADLAGTIPREKYGWRPAEGVRSISEVFMHIGLANYQLAAMAGAKTPAGIGRDAETTVTERDRVVAFLKQSFAHVRNSVIALRDADLEKPAKLFREESTVRGVYFTGALHIHEHLGQAIAYARVNGIVPPWTAAEQAQPQRGDRK